MKQVRLICPFISEKDAEDAVLKLLSLGSRQAKEVRVAMEAHAIAFKSHMAANAAPKPAPKAKVVVNRVGATVQQKKAAGAASATAVKAQAGADSVKGCHIRVQRGNGTKDPLVPTAVLAVRPPNDHQAFFDGGDFSDDEDELMA